MYVITFSGDHLAFLCFRYTLGRIEYDNFCARQVLKAFESCLTCITGCRGQDADLSVLAGLSGGRGHQVRQELERHILKCRRRTMPQFEDVLSRIVLVELYERSRLLTKLFFSICLLAVVQELVISEVCEELTDNSRRDLRVSHLGHRHDLALTQLRDLLRHEQTAIRGNTLLNGFCCRELLVITSGTYIHHGKPSPYLTAYASACVSAAVSA